METSETDTPGAPVTAVATHANGTEMEIELTIGIISDGTQSAIGAVAASDQPGIDGHWSRTPRIPPTADTGGAEHGPSERAI